MTTSQTNLNEDGDKTSPSQEAQLESTCIKLMAVPGLVLNTIVSTLVLAGIEKQWTIGGVYYRTIDQNRATTQIIVQIVAGILGTVHVYTFCTVINFSSRLALAQRPMALDRLKFFPAISTPRMDWDLPMKDAPFVFLIILLTWIPSALWAGAITPVTSSSPQVSTALINVPRYTQDSYSYWSQGLFNDNGANISNSKGVFSYLPIRDRYGFLLVDGSAASSVDGTIPLRKRSDNTNITYYGRSYGVGSSVGLVDGSIRDVFGTIGYRYNETGYKTEVRCITNASLQFSLHLIKKGHSSGSWIAPSLYLATGSGPGPVVDIPKKCLGGALEFCDGYVISGFKGSGSIVAFGWWASLESGLSNMGVPRSARYLHQARPSNSAGLIGIAAGAQNADLNNTQCSIEMIPTSFELDVDMQNRIVTVKPQDIQDVMDIEPSGFVADSASAAVTSMSWVDSSCFSSHLADMFRRNVNNVREQNRSLESAEQASLRAIAESTQAIIDDHLLAIASAQIIVAGDYDATPVIVLSQALAIGSRNYAIAIVCMNSAAVLLYVGEAVRKRGWKGMKKFNYNDVKSVIVGSSLGGKAVAEQVNLMHCRRDGRSKWAGDPDDRVAGAIKVTVDPCDTTLILSNDEETSPRGEAPQETILQGNESPT